MFVIVTRVLTQFVSAGEIEKFAVGFEAVVIGSTVPLVKPHGFSAFILTKKELGVCPPVAPHDELVNKCTK